MAFLALCSCNRMGGRSFMPAISGYGNAPASTTLLKKPLREISGISYRSPSELLAVNDELGLIFTVNPINSDYSRRPFGKKGDYEEMVQTPEGYFVLKSNGDLHQLDAGSFEEINVYSGSFPRYTEFESMAYDPKSHQLLLICKTCGRNADSIFVWRFDLHTRNYLVEPAFTIPLRAIRNMGKDDTLECQPSAAAYHPIRNTIFILASIGKILLECTPDGKLLSVHGINGDVFQQPEGICFAPNGDMYIANEGRQSKATILYFPYQQANNVNSL